MKHLTTRQMNALDPWRRRAAFAVLVTTAAVFSGVGTAQEHKTHRIVFEVTSVEAQVWEALMNNIENVQRAFGIDATDVRVVVHGKGIGLVMKTNSAFGDRIAALTTPRVTFVACENTMKRLGIGKEDLLPAAGTVDSGVAEVVRLQETGWSYIKPGL